MDILVYALYALYALYAVSFAMFIIGLSGLTAPKSAVRGNKIAAAGMAVAFVATLIHIRDTTSWLVIESWLRGVGAAAIDNLMEDAATAEISRSQVWQWIHNNSVTTEGTRIDEAWAEQALADVVSSLERTPGYRFDDAVQVFRASALEPEFPTFLTIGAYVRYL
jgi:malate synthase